MLAFEDGVQDQHLGRLARRLGIEPCKSADRFADVSRQIGEYFARRRRGFSFPVDCEVVDDAPRRVLDVVTPGAIRQGRQLPRAVVGDASSWNRPSTDRRFGGEQPIALVVPCHRVLRADGRVGGFLGGIDRKTELLSLEGSTRGDALLGARPTPTQAPRTLDQLNRIPCLLQAFSREPLQLPLRLGWRSSARPPRARRDPNC